jgi:MYXO-CTERM domain-containing protein
MRRLAVPVLLALASSSAARAESIAHTPVSEVDLLIVVDSSPEAAGARAAFVAGIPAFVQTLGDELHGDTGQPMIDLHVGVVTADRADGGALRAVAVADCAAAPRDRYAAYRSDQWGSATENYDGTLAEAMRCLIPLEGHGSSTTEPLRAIRAALDDPPTANEGFLRPNAALAVLVVTTHDDCSSAGAPLDPFACAAAAWQCTPAIDATAGPRANCSAAAAPNGLSPWRIDDELGFHKVSKSQIAFGVVRGLPSPVAVVSGPAIQPSCTSGAIAATPALRLDAAANAFTNSWLEVACDDDGFASFVYPIVAATYPPIGDRDVGGLACDGGSYGDFSDAGVGGHGADDRTHAFGCACSTGAPSTGTGALFALALAFALRRRRR